MKNLVIIAVVFWALFMNGFSYIKSFMGNNNLQNIPQTVLKGASTIAAPAPRVTTAGLVPSRPAINVAPVAVIPQGMPSLPTTTPVPQPVAGMSDAESTQNAEIAKMIMATPTPVQYGTEECNASNATFRGKKTVEKDGIPIGQVEAISCTSQAEVDEGLRIREYAMIANHQ